MSNDDKIIGWADQSELYPVWMPTESETWPGTIHLTREQAERIQKAFEEFAACQRILADADRRGKAMGHDPGWQYEECAKALASWLKNAPGPG